jgi:DNA transformation protein
MGNRLRDLMNLGPASEKMLKAVDIRTPEDLEALGAVEAFRRVRDCELNPSLNLLYALEGALTGVPWNELPDELRARLLIAVDEYNEARRLRKDG